MTVQEAKAVILTLAKYLDGKPSVVLSQDWKLKLALATKVLKENNIYAESEQGMYLTISISKVNGTASTIWMPIKDESVSNPSSSIDEIYKSMLIAQSTTQSSPATESAPDLNI